MNDKIDKIDAILPQTQCGLCGFGGCRPYAAALAENRAEINLCPPGGVKGLHQIAHLVGQDPSSYEEDMKGKSKPTLRAVIREAECIGCTKCVNACPVDAIVGAAKSMHSILQTECNGCELCIAPCPVDCIDLVELPFKEISMEESQHYRARFNAKQKRLKKEEDEKFAKLKEKSTSQKMSFIEEALLRVKNKM